VGVCVWVDSVAGGNALHADGLFLPEKEITGTVSERAVKLGGTAEIEKIKNYGSRNANSTAAFLNQEEKHSF